MNALFSVIMVGMKKVIFAIAIFLACFANVNAQVFNRNQAMKVATAAAIMTPGSKIFSIAATGSMKPMMDEHCLVVIVKEPFSNINVRDVVIYTQSKTQQNVIHRVMEKKKDGKLWTLGDNNSRPDKEFVTADNYVGKVCTVVYYRGDSVENGPVAVASIQD